MSPRSSMITAAIAVSGLVMATNAAGVTVNYLPAEHKQGEVTYVTGGVGHSESDAVRRAATHYPLELEFLLKAKPKDEYLSAVKVRINDVHDRTVLDVTADGPFLLARMPAGKYVVVAEHAGKTERRNIEIIAKEHHRVVFEWQS